MTAPLRVLALCILGASQTADVSAQQSGWGVVVNRLQHAVVLDVRDSSGRASAWTLAPGGTLKLRSSRSYTATVRGAGTWVTLDATPLWRVPDLSDPGRISWHREPLPEEFPGPRSPLALRYYQVVGRDETKTIVRGFTNRDAQEIVEMYANRMRDAGFALTKPVVYAPFSTLDLYGYTMFPDKPSPTPGQAAIFGRAARRLQHRVLGESVLDWAVSGVDDVQHDDEWSKIRLAFFTPDDESSEVPEPQRSEETQPPPNQTPRATATAVIEDNLMSPEFERLFVLVLAEVFGCPPDEIGLFYPAPTAAAPGPPLKIRPELIGQHPDRTLDRIKGKVRSVLDAEGFLRSAGFSEFDLSLRTQEGLGPPRRTAVLETRSKWRYHSIDDSVVGFAATSVEMGPIHLRWRIVTSVAVNGFESSEPLMSTHVFVQIQTKRVLLSDKYYVDWPDAWPSFVVEPLKGDHSAFDVEAKTFEIRKAIEEVCTLPFVLP